MYLNNKSNRNNYFFVMFSITVSMKNKWKISTSLVYVLVIIMDIRYNNSNIFFPLFSVFLMTQNFLQFSCFSKKRFKNYLSNFFVSMHRLLGGFDDRFLEGVAFCCCFLRAFWREKSKTEVRHRQTGNGFQVPIDTFSYENLADGEL